jgi:hypothetical protein
VNKIFKKKRISLEFFFKILLLNTESDRLVFQMI